MRSLWLAAAAAALGAGVWGGLYRLGAGIPPLLPHHAAAHGPLMVGGFLGILAGAELAAAAGRRWVWLTPALATAAVLWTIVRPEPRPAAWLLTSAAVPALAAAAGRLRRRPAFARGVTALGLFWWLMGNLEWAALGVLPVAVPCWMTFAVLFVVGRRLELAETTPSRGRKIILAAGLAILFAGLLGAYFDHGLGVRVFGAGCAAIALWGLHGDSGSASGVPAEHRAGGVPGLALRAVGARRAGLSVLSLLRHQGFPASPGGRFRIVLQGRLWHRALTRVT
jgi:hypothetical protein